MAAGPDHTTVDDTQLSATNSNLLTIMTETLSITDWSVLALLLGLSDPDYKRIVRNEDNAHKAIISRWLDSGAASWSVLVQHLCNPLVGKVDLANTIARKYPSKRQPIPTPPSSNSVSTSTGTLSDTDDIWKKSPDPNDAVKVTKDISNKWNEIGQALSIPNNDREQLRTNVSYTGSAKLEQIFVKWSQSECSNVTWKNLFDVMKDVDKDIARRIKSFLTEDSTQKKYKHKPIWEPL